MTCSLVAKLLRMSEVDYRMLWTSRLSAYNCFLECFFFGNHLKVSVNAVKIKRNKCINVFPQLILFTHKNLKYFVYRKWMIIYDETVFWTPLSSLIAINRNTVSRGWLWWDIQNISAVVDFYLRYSVSCGIPLLLWQHTSSSGLLSHQNRGGIAVGSVLINLTCCYFL